MKRQRQFAAVRALFVLMQGIQTGTHVSHLKLAWHPYSNLYIVDARCMGMLCTAVDGCVGAHTMQATI
jgi:hypothetical protein